jgi:hypothetical protein
MALPRAASRDENRSILFTDWGSGAVPAVAALDLKPAQVREMKHPLFGMSGHNGLRGRAA